ncbi:DUF4826 family protein [Ferrimonas sediminicola]|uniref:DUF4826 family protein n=1 Tax=Ferrimonas sediminicola TaxID=2569538 RepID=A0A4U1BCX9_9GAMM|nr:DUF4826 family protein [Ferrimonas sediminicola]TKB48909.1 DUF4826 family protein [Ferrimonas sediminicola]
MTEQQQPQMQEQQWIRTQFQKANRHMAEKGLIPGKVYDKESRVLPPYLTLWKIMESGKGQKYWVLSGDLPTDLVEDTHIKSAREALRHFSLNWQLKAENIRRTSTDKTQLQFAALMISRAESMAQMQMDDRLWAAEAGA